MTVIEKPNQTISDEPDAFARTCDDTNLIFEFEIHAIYPKLPAIRCRGPRADALVSRGTPFIAAKARFIALKLMDRFADLLAPRWGFFGCCESPRLSAAHSWEQLGTRKRGTYHVPSPRLRSYFFQTFWLSYQVPARIRAVVEAERTALPEGYSRAARVHSKESQRPELP